MNRKVTLASLTAGLLTVSAFAAAPAQADERTCRGTIGSTTVDNLLVPQGATCTLDGTTVKGTITVKGDATLRAAHVRVVGNVQSENAKRVVLRGSSVGGSVQHVQGARRRSTTTGSTATSRCSATTARSPSRATGSMATFNASPTTRLPPVATTQ